MAWLSKLLAALFKGALGKLTFLFAGLWHALEGLLGSGLSDDTLRLLAHMLADSEAGRVALVQLYTALSGAFGGYWAVLKWTLLVALALAAAALVPLALRAWAARRPAVFISFQNEREALARQLHSTLEQHGFKVLRLPFDPRAGHQQVLGGMQEMQRRADALVCLPGHAASAVDNEVYAASVLQQPVLFLLSERGGSLPNFADKRYPVLSLEIVQAADYRPVADLLHFVTRDLHSTANLYGQSLRHPLLHTRLLPALMVPALLLGLLLATSAAHGFAVTTDLVAAGGELLLRRGEAVMAQVLLLMAAALFVVLPTAYLGLVLRNLWVQLRAARKASLQAGEAEFSRDAWVGLIPGLTPGQVLYRALLQQAPLAHHERGQRRRARA